jgi:hypothetical protein
VEMQLSSIRLLCCGRSVVRIRLTACITSITFYIVFMYQLQNPGNLACEFVVLIFVVSLFPSMSNLSLKLGENDIWAFFNVWHKRRLRHAGLNRPPPHFDPGPLMRIVQIHGANFYSMEADPGVQLFETTATQSLETPLAKCRIKGVFFCASAFINCCS